MVCCLLHIFLPSSMCSHVRLAPWSSHIGVFMPWNLPQIRAFFSRHPVVSNIFQHPSTYQNKNLAISRCKQIGKTILESDFPGYFWFLLPNTLSLFILYEHPFLWGIPSFSFRVVGPKGGSPQTPAFPCLRWAHELSLTTRSTSQHWPRPWPLGQA